MTLLLSVLLPPAKIGFRILATLCDLTLIFFLNVFIIGKLWLPIYHPDALMQLRFLIETYLSQIQAGNFSEFVQQINCDAVLVDTLVNVDRILFLVTWLYYVINALYFQGGSLGKQMFNLRVLKLSSLKIPSKWDFILRSGIQTFFIFTAWPFLMCLNLCFMCLNSLRRGLPDWFCQTYVVHFGTMEQLQQKLKEQSSNNQEIKS
jgi:uncharacterized RDD family membrane protein YckC